MLALQEEYQASGSSIKRAQHAAAQRALEETSLPRPVARPAHHAQAPLTPTVELNALAMKRGELATYRVVELPQLAYLPPLNFQGELRSVSSTACILEASDCQFFFTAYRQRKVYEGRTILICASLFLPQIPAARRSVNPPAMPFVPGA